MIKLIKIEAEDYPSENCELYANEDGTLLIMINEEHSGYTMSCRLTYHQVREQLALTINKWLEK